MRVLNVGGGGTRIIPSHYEGWDQDLLDIDSECKPDICCDALEMPETLYEKYNAVYCSHNIEHFYKHDVTKLLINFRNVLIEGGSVEIHTPNIMNMIKVISERGLDIDDVWYRTSQGLPITFHDTLYGWGKAIASGNLYYAHKCGFSAISLYTILEQNGFINIQIEEQGSNLMAIAVKGF